MTHIYQPLGFLVGALTIEMSGKEILSVMCLQLLFQNMMLLNVVLKKRYFVNVFRRFVMKQAKVESNMGVKIVFNSYRACQQAVYAGLTTQNNAADENALAMCRGKLSSRERKKEVTGNTGKIERDV